MAGLCFGDRGVRPQRRPAESPVGSYPGIDVQKIRPLGGLGEIARLGLTLAEAKQILARLRLAVVAVQADDHSVLPLDYFRAVKRVTSRTGGFIGWRRCLARWRCGSRGFAVPAVVMARPVSAGRPIAGPHLSSASCEHMLLL